MKSFSKWMTFTFSVVLTTMPAFPLAETTSAQVWNRQSFEGGTDIEIIPDSMQVDSLGRIHIMHRRGGMLIYHRYDGTGWIREILPAEPICTSPYLDPSFEFCLDPDDLPLVVYCADNNYISLSRDENGWKPAGRSCACDIDGNAHHTYREFDNSIDCDRLYHCGPEGLTELDLCYWDEGDYIDMIALRKYRYPTVVFVDCDGCSIHIYWVSDEGRWKDGYVASSYFQYCWSSCYYMMHDREGDAHILYQYDSTGLSYFHWSPEGAVWSTTIEGTGTGNIAVDNLQTAHRGYCWDGCLKYARIDVGNVYTEIIDPGDTWVDMVSSGVLPDLNPLVLAYDHVNGELILWSKTNEEWAPLVLDRKTTEIGSFASVTGLSGRRYVIYADRTSRALKFGHQEDAIWAVETLMEFAGKTPGLCSLASDRQNRLHMTCCLPDGGIMYGLKAGDAAWQMETIPVAGVVSGLDLATDPAANPLICYQDGNLVLLKKPATDWESTLLDGGGTVSGDLSICAGCDGSISVLYSRAAEPGTDVVYLSGDVMKWRTEIVGSHDGPAGSCDLVLDGSDQPRAVITRCIDGGSPDEVWNVDLAYRSGSGWSLSTIGTGRGMTDAAIGLDSKNAEHIVCQDRESGCLYYRRHETRWLPALIADPDGGLPEIDLALDNDDQVSIMFRSENGLIHTQQNLPEVGVRLDMPYNEFTRGNSCYLYAYLNNQTGEPIEANLFILLQYGSGVWFYPSWSADFSGEPGICFEPVDLPGGSLVCKEIIPWFDWTHEPMGCEGLVFYGAMVDPGLTRILGDMDGLGEWEFNI